MDFQELLKLRETRLSLQSEIEKKKREIKNITERVRIIEIENSTTISVFSFWPPFKKKVSILDKENAELIDALNAKSDLLFEETFSLREKIDNLFKIEIENYH